MLTVDVGSGGGSIRLDGIPLPHYPYTKEIGQGTTVILEAAPRFGHVFKGWSGDLNTTGNPVIILIDCDKEISASFSIDWLLYGSIGGCLILAALLSAVLFIRRRDDTVEKPLSED
jgi:hypothetical protein